MKKWAIWKTILVALASVTMVVGVTVLGVYFAGGFEGNKVNPTSISFVLDDDAYNSSNSQFEVSEDFYITITGVSENENKDITATDVTLSLSGGGSVSETTKDGVKYIYDSVIMVPQTVTLGEPFLVTLCTSPLTYESGTLSGDNFRDESGNLVYWISGGISTITAKSENTDLSTISVQVAVDVPVYSITTVLTNFEGTALTDVTASERFLAEVTFFPSSSKYIYSDDKNSSISTPREKNYYIESKSTQVSFVYSSEQSYLQAGEISNDNEITSYVFKSGAEQISQLSNYAENSPDASDEQTYNAILSYLASAGEKAVSNSATIDIVEASVGSFEVGLSGQTLTMTAGKTFTISMKSNDYADAALAATVTSTDSQELTSMLRKVALRFEVLSSGSTYTDVTNELTISAGSTVEIDGVTYYYANTAPASYANAQWSLFSSSSYTFRVTAVLVISTADEGGETQTLFTSSYTFTVKCEQNEEADVYWTDTSAITCTLDFDGAEITPASISLDGLGYAPSSNVYRSIVYFAYFGAMTEEEITQIIGSNYSSYGIYAFGENLTLYALKDAELTLCGTGSFKLYFATVQTDQNGGYVYDDNGNFIIVKYCADYIDVNVTKTLHSTSVQSVTASTSDEGVYLYEGTSETVQVVFTIDEDSWEVFKDKLSSGKIDFAFVSGSTDITSYFVVSDYTLDEAALTVTYTASVKGSLGLSGAGILVGYAQLSDDTNLVWKLALNTTIYIYTPEVQTVNLASDNIDFSETIKVKQALSTNSITTTITYVNTSGNEAKVTSVDAFLNLLSVTVTDQHGNTEIFDSSWSYVSSSSLITSSGTAFAFGSGTVNGATVYAYAGGVASSNVLKFNVSSTGIALVETSTSKAIGTDTDFEEEASISDVGISKYAAKGGSIILKSTLKLYTDSAGTSEFSDNSYAITFSSSYLDSLSDSDVVALFYGTDGSDAMLSINGSSLSLSTQTSTSALAAAIRDELSNKIITTIKVNYDFGVDHVLKLTIVDYIGSTITGAVRINFNVTLLANVSCSGDTSFGTSSTVYASYSNSVGTSTVITYASDSTQTTLSALLALHSSYYIVTSDGGISYKLQRAEPDTDAGEESIGRVLSDGSLYFDDFWTSETRTYTIYFYYNDIENSFASSLIFSVTVTRNVQVSQSNTTYYYVLPNDRTESNNQSLSYYISVSRIVTDVSTIALESLSSFSVSYAITTNSYILIDDATFEQNSVPVFGYGQTSFTLSVSVSIVGTLVNSFDITFDSGVTYENLATGFTNGGMGAQAYATGKVETYDGVEYLSLTSDYWYFSPTLSAYDSNYTFSVSTMYNSYSQSSKYSVTTDTQTSYYYITLAGSTSDALYGLGSTSDYIIVRVSESGSVKFVMLVPYIASRVGRVLAVYDSEPTYAQALSASSLIVDGDSYISTDDLLSSGTYATVTAGDTYVIARGYTDFDAESYTISSSVTTDASDYGYGLYFLLSYAGESYSTTLVELEYASGYYSSLVSAITYSEQTNSWSITLNHLDSTITDAFVTLALTVYNGTFTQVYYYVLHVEADVTTAAAVYPYSSAVEYIDCDTNTTLALALDEVYDESKVSSGKYRFNVNTISGDRVSGLESVFTIVSITNSAGSDITSSYSSNLTIEFLSQADGAIMYVTPLDSGSYTIVIRRTYTTVVGGEIEFTFMLNGSTDYSLSYSLTDASTSITKTGSDATWTISRIDGNQFSLTVNLIQTTTSGGSSTANTIYGKLSQTFVSSDGAIASVYYNSTAEADATASASTLLITLSSFISEDTVAYIYFYTDQGLIGTLTIDIGGSVKVALASDLTISGGTQNKSLSDYISSVTWAGQSSPSYTTSAQVYSVTCNGEAVSNTNFVSLSGSAVSVTYITQEYEVTFRVSVTYSGNTYSFYMTLTLEPNVTKTSGGVITVEEQSSSSTAQAAAETITGSGVYAGSSLEISLTSLFTASGSATNSSYSATWAVANSSGSALSSDSGSSASGKITLSTVAVSGNTTVVLLIKVTLGDYETFYVRYSFIVYTNVVISTSYPIPYSTELDAEYIASGSTYSSASAFVTGTATFAEEQRITVALSTALAATNSASTNSITVAIYTLQNAKVTYGSGTTLAEGDVIYQTGSNAIDLSSLTFSIDSTSSSSSPTIELSITCNEVTGIYTIKLLEQVYSFAFNYANKTSNTETLFYEDLGSSTNIFENARLLSLTVNTASQNTEISSIVTGDYVVVLSNGSNYVYYDISLTTSYIGQTMIYDLGSSYSGYTIYGIYAYDEDIVEDASSHAYSGETDMSEALFSNYALTSRITATYAGYQIEYTKLNSILSMTIDTLDYSMDTGGSDTVYSLPVSSTDTTYTLTSFTITESSDTGLADTATNFTNYSYAFTASLDIAVTNGITYVESTGELQGTTYTTIYARQELDLITMAGIYHPSTGEALSTSDLVESSTTSILLEVYGLTNGYTINASESSAFYSKLQSEYSGIEAPYYTVGSSQNRYIAISSLEDSNKIYNYSIRGLGATNGGNFALLRITYSATVNGSDKTSVFYMVVLVLPDYNISYQVAGSGTTDDDNCITNENNIYTVTPSTTNEGYYDDILLAGSDSSGSTPVVSVSHKYGYDAGTDVASTGFTYTMTLDEASFGLNDSVATFNISTNVSSKLSTMLASTVSGTTTLNWAKSTSSSTTVYTYQGSTVGISITDALEVVLGTQYFRFKAVDGYGYVFYVCIGLSPEGATPTFVTNGTTLVEGGNLDFGLTTEVLSLSASSSNVVDISSQSSVVTLSNTTVLALSGIESWGFDYSNDSTMDTLLETYFTKKDAGGYTVNDDYEISSDDEKYLEVPASKYITVTGVSYYYQGACLASETLSNKLLSPTTLQYNYGSDGYTTRTTDNGGINGITTVPELNGSVYAGATEVEVTLVLTLQYAKDQTNIEVCEISTTVIISSSYSIASKTNNVVRDGVNFDISNYITVTKEGTSLTSSVNYYDDTLLVVLEGSSGVAFTVSATIDEVDYSGSYSYTNNNSYIVSNYVSISTLLGHTTMAGSTITLTVTSTTGTVYIKNSGTEYYDSSDENSSATVTITPAAITQETLNLVRNSQIGSQKYCSVTKYYIVAITTQASGTSCFQYTQIYYVTNYLYSLVTNITTSELSVEATAGSNDIYTVSFATWASGFAAYGAQRAEGATSISADESANYIGALFSTSYSGNYPVYFVISTMEGGDEVEGSGAATISDTGTITTTSDFNISSHYLKIVIKQKISGYDGTFATESSSDSTLATVYLRLTTA